MINGKLINKYNTNERVIGTWFGKPLYSKTFTGYTTKGNYNHNLSSVDEIWVDIANSFIKKTTGRVFPACYVAQSGIDEAFTSVNSTQILIDGTIANLSTITITLKYTKTSD